MWDAQWGGGCRVIKSEEGCHTLTMCRLQIFMLLLPRDWKHCLEEVEF